MASDGVEKSPTTFRGKNTATTLGLLAELSRRLPGLLRPGLPGLYTPPYKTGPEWLKDFLGMSEDERAQTFQFTPELYLLRIGIEHTAETELGSIYNRILLERSRGKRRASNGGGVDVSRMRHINLSLEKALGEIQQNVARLQDEPDWKYEITLLTAEGPTPQEARKRLKETASGYELRWHLVDKVESLRPQVARAVLLRTLDFPIGNDNMVSTRPNFGARLESDEGSKRIMELYWGWGNPHIFYGMDITETEGPDSKFILRDKVVVASAFEIAKGFVFTGSFPQDMVLGIPVAN